MTRSEITLLWIALALAVLAYLEAAEVSAAQSGSGSIYNPNRPLTA